MGNFKSVAIFKAKITARSPLVASPEHI